LIKLYSSIASCIHNEIEGQSKSVIKLECGGSFENRLRLSAQLFQKFVCFLPADQLFRGSQTRKLIAKRHQHGGMNIFPTLCETSLKSF
jgi:hypothetical protein